MMVHKTDHIFSSNMLSMDFWRGRAPRLVLMNSTYTFKKLSRLGFTLINEKGIIKLHVLYNFYIFRDSSAFNPYIVL